MAQKNLSHDAHFISMLQTIIYIYFYVFPDVLADNGRITLAGEVIAAFGKMMSAHRGEVLCTVTTAQVQIDNFTLYITHSLFNLKTPFSMVTCKLRGISFFGVKYMRMWILWCSKCSIVTCRLRFCGCWEREILLKKNVNVLYSLPFTIFIPHHTHI